MIITISGTPGAGDTTAADALGKELDYKVIKIGEMCRKLAEEKELEIEGFWKKQEENPKKLEEFNREIDKKQKKIALKQENVVLNGKLSAYHLQNADLKIFLTADIEERAKRVLMRKKIGRKNYADKIDNGENEEDEKLKPKEIKKQIERIKKREEKETKYWEKIYGYNYIENKEKYNYILDTTDKKPSEVINQIKEKIKEMENE
ncbi:MAG: cytidylate kinase family protein [archaeon]